MENYSLTRLFWDNIFQKSTPCKYEDANLQQEDLNQASIWLSNGSNSIIDYGCGNGTFLFDCALRGTKYHIGIDISAEAIALAKERAKLSEMDHLEFIQGGLDSLEQIEENTMDAAILSNIVDNMIPNDAELVLHNIHRIVHPGGKILIKVNPLLTEEQIKKENIKDLGNDLLLEPTGLYLWNLKTEKWCDILEKYFSLYIKKDIYFKEYDQSNRLFLLINK